MARSSHAPVATDVAVGEARPPPPPSCPGGSPWVGEDEACGDLARMIALHGHDPSIVEDGYFRSFVRRLNPGFEVPSRRAIEEMCDGVFDEARKGLFSWIGDTNTPVNVAVGKAKIAGAGEVLYTACHYIDAEWKLHKVVLGAFVLVPDHPWHGTLLGVPEVILPDPEMCDEVSDDLIHLITMDGKVLDEAFMVVWTIMGSFRLSEFVKKRIISMNGVMIPELCHTAYVDNVLHTIARCFRYANWRFTYDVHSEMRTLNAMTRQEREKLLSDLGLECLRAYDEDWYSCYCSLEILRKKTSSTTTVTISKFSQLLCKLWGAIYRAIRTISASRCPTSNLCLIELLKLREVLQYEQATNSDDDDITERLLREAKDRLDEAIRDSYLVWSIPLVLDPRYKLKYIKFGLERAFGSEAAANMISEVARTINHVYTCVNMEDDDEDDGEISVDNADPLEQAWDEECLLQDSIREVDNCPEAKTTELDRYLQDPLVPRVKGFDILKWWKKNSQKYPKVAQIARPALAMPTCSKLSSGQIAYVRSIVRGYSKYPYIPLNQYE